MNAQQSYWRAFNFIARRVVAPAFALVGGLGALSGVPALIDPEGTVLVNGVPDHDLVWRIIAVALPAVVAVFGVLMYRARPYSPGGASKPNNSLERSREP